MSTEAAAQEFLHLDHIAFVGASRNPKSFASSVYRHLRDGGRTLYPVNDVVEEATIEGDPCFRHLADVPDDAEGVLVMVPAADAAGVVGDAIGKGIRHVWLHRGFGPGSVSEDAVRLCEENGVSVVAGACPFMFDEPPTGVHRLHRRLAEHRLSAEPKTSRKAS